MDPLTARQAQVLEFVKEEILRHGRPPSVREIAARFGMASTNGVRRHLAALQKKGYIRLSFRSSRGISLAPELREASGLPVIGRVAAGTPITAIENVEGHLPLAGLFAGARGLYCLRVSGQSMINAGILDGDYVIVRPKPDFENGEIGVAVVGEEATVKRLRRVGRCVELLPANERFGRIRVDPAGQEFRYGGKVVGVFRNMESSR